MRKLLLFFVFSFLLTYLCYSQGTWEKIDTCKVKIIESKDETIIIPEYNSRLDKEFWNVVIGDKTFCNIEEVRSLLEEFDFHSSRCIIDEKSNSLVFTFEKIIKETSVYIKNEE